MAKRFVCINYEMTGGSSDDLALWKGILEDAAEWGGADESEVTINFAKSIISVCIECEDDPMLLIEAGIALGFCERIKEETKHITGQLSKSWLSYLDENRSSLDSTL